MASFNQVFGGGTIYPSEPTYLLLDLAAANLTLVWPTEQQIGGNVVADIIDLTSSVTFRSVTLPDARQASTGFTALFNNVGAQDITIKDSTGATIATVQSGTVWQIYLRNNSTAAGLWRTFQFGASVSVSNAAALASLGLLAIGSTLITNLTVTRSGGGPGDLTVFSRRCFIWSGGVGAATLPIASSITPANGFYVWVRNSGSGNLTITPTTSLINGAVNKVLTPGQSCLVVSDGTDYFTLGG